jgi:Gpi18-like mannosyltransferase
MPLQKSAWLISYLASTAIVLAGIAFGRAFIPTEKGHSTEGESYWEAFFHWDGIHYRDIARSGYEHDPHRRSLIHFFPLFALVGRCVMAVTGLPADVALLLVSNAAFGASLYLLGRYCELRCKSGNEDATAFAVLALSFVPAGLFFRMAYSESLFLLTCIATLYLIERRAPVLAVAAIVGLATGVRPVGIALVPPFLLYLVESSKDRGQLLRTAILGLPLCCAGLLGFTLYCAWSFGEPFAFADNLKYWYMRPAPGLQEKLVSLATFEPVWSIFREGSPSYWERHTTLDKVFFILYAANPVYFVVTVVLLAIGTWYGWLNPYERLAGWGLLLIPYWTTAVEVHMTGMARYTTVILPAYLVLGRLLAKVGPEIRLGLFVLSACYLAIYSALFAQWYWFV